MSSEGYVARRLAALVLLLAPLLAFSAPSRADAQPAPQPQPPTEQTTAQQMAAAGAAASAQMDAEARSRFSVGQTLYQAGRFGESAREFEAAYQLSHRPELLFNVYVANRDANELEKAVPALRDYLAAMPATLPNRINLQARLQAMEASLAERTAAAQLSEQQAADVAAAQERANAAEAAQQEAAERARVRRANPPFQLSIPGVIIGSVGVAAVAGGFIVGALALGKVSDLETMCPDDRCPASATSSLDAAKTLVTTADILLIGGAVLAAAGLTMVLFEIGAPSDSDAGASAIASCGPTGCLAVVSGRF